VTWAANIVHNGRVTIVLRAAAAVLLASVSMACAGVHARTIPQSPPLEVPPPPAPIEVPFAADPDPPAAQPSSTPGVAGSAITKPKGTPQKPAPPRKPDVPEKAETPPATPPVVTAAETGPPAANLQTTANVDELVAKIQGLLKRAAGDLERIEKSDVKRLSAAARAQYDEAKRFAEQADAALKVKNLAFAEQLADKAATLAGLLVKRAPATRA